MHPALPRGSVDRGKRNGGVGFASQRRKPPNTGDAMKARVASGERLVFIDLEAVLVGEERKIIQIAAIAVGPDLVPLESFEVKLRIVDKVIPLSYLSREPTIWKRLGRQPNDASFMRTKQYRRHRTTNLERFVSTLTCRCPPTRHTTLRRMYWQHLMCIEVCRSSNASETCGAFPM